MSKDLHVLLIEDDPYARDLMSMLLTRDWRTRITAEVGSENDVRKIIEEEFHIIDTIILDTEAPGDPDWHFRIAEIAEKSADPPRVLYTATLGDVDTLSKIIESGSGGYIIKREIGYSLADAVARATKYGKFILTPTGYRLALREHLQLPEKTIVLDGRKSIIDLTPREKEIARLAVLFNHPHRELSDELLIRADQVAKHVSNVYSKLGLDELLNGEVEPEVFFEDKLILNRFKSILSRVAENTTRRKTPDMATLAFHLLTVPEVREVL